MSILNNLMDSILGHGTTPAVPSTSSTPLTPGSPSATSSPTGTSGTSGQAATAVAVDVTAVLTARAAKKGEKLNWQSSIVDLMKLAGVDNSVTQRKALAKELGYTGNVEDTTVMDTWLHRQVMKQLAEHGGTVPAEMPTH